MITLEKTSDNMPIVNVSRRNFLQGLLCQQRVCVVRRRMLHFSQKRREMPHPVLTAR